MALEDFSSGRETAPIFNSLNPGDLAAPDSAYEEYRRRTEKFLNAGPAEEDARAPELAAKQNNPDAPGAYALQTFDPDPFGTEAQKLARQRGESVDSNYVDSLVVAGKRMSRAELESSEDGRALLAAAIERRQGHKAGFWETFTNFGVTDLPFFGLAATVGGSIADAKMVSDIMRKVDRGEEITDAERLKLGRYTFEGSKEKTVEGMVGDIVRAAPGFMFEFLASGTALSGIRTGIAKVAGESSVGVASTLAVNRGTKILAGELGEQALKDTLAKSVTTGAARADVMAAVRALDDVAKDEMTKRVSTSLYGFVAETMGRKAPKASAGALAKTMNLIENPGPYGDEFIQTVTDNIARKAVDAAIARKGASTAFNEWMVGMGQSIRSHAARALFDFGTWGTETSTMLDAGFNTVRGAVADALGATVIEAPIRGAMMYLPNRLVAQPLTDLATGGMVTQSELSLQASSLRTGDRKLMDMSGLIAEGMDLMEYVSENAGRGFGSGMRAIGLASGLAKPAERALVGSVGEILRADAKVEAGGFVRKMIRKALGTTEQYAARTAETQTKAISSYLAKNGVEMTDDAVAAMVRSKAVPDSIAAFAGKDFGKFATRAVKDAMEDEAVDLSYKRFFHYAVADFMARNNFGPEQTLNAFQRMGYDGILGEMYEERYSDFMKGLCGLDDNKTHSFRENLGRAFRNIYPEEGWRQLVAEAIGFAVPAVTRSAVLNVQRVLGGSSEVDRARAAGRNMRDAVIGMSVYEDRIGTFDTVMNERKRELEDALAESNVSLEAQRRMLEGQHITDPNQVAELTKEHTAKVTEAQEALDRHVKYVADTYKANGITEVSERIAGNLMRFAVLPSLKGEGQFASKMEARYSSEQLADAKAAQDALLAEAAFLGASYDEARQYGLGDQNVGMWRRIAAKTVGIAGALICGEPALAQVNSIKWAAVDEGLDPHLAEDLGNLHRELREEATLELRKAHATEEPTKAQIDEYVSKAGYEKRAKDLVRNHMLLSGVRMFAHSEMLDRAAVHLAEKRGYYYDPEKREFTTTGGPAAERIPFRKFVEDNRREVEDLRDSIGLETLRILTDSDTHLAAVPGQYVSFLKLKPGDPTAVPTARMLAAQMSGFGHLVSERRLAQGVSVETQLAADSVAISEELVKAVDQFLQKDPKGDNVPSELIEHLAREMQYPAGTMTDEALAKRRRDILDTVRVATHVLTGEVRAFQRHVDVGESRLSDDTVRTVLFEKNPATGLWTTTDEVRDGKTNAYAATWQGDDAQLQKLVEDNALVPTSRKIVLTTARALTTDDPVLMLQKIGGAEQLMQACRKPVEGGYDYSRVHPALRLNDQTHQPLLATKAEVDAAVRREAFMADYASTHETVSDYNFEKAEWTPETEKLCVQRRAEYMKMKENVLGENGYMTLINRSLAAQGVDCPGADSLVQSALGRAKAKSYTIGLNQYTARHRSADYYVSVDYSAGVDPISAMVYSAVSDGFRRYAPRFLNAGTGAMRNAICTYFRDLDDLVEKAMYDARISRAAREELSKLHAAVTGAFEAPSVKAISTVATALVCGQLERARAAGHSSTPYDGAFAAIAKDAKDLGSYIQFSAVVDLFLGGTGFEDLRAVRDAGGDPAKLPQSGILRILRLTGASGSMTDVSAAMKPAGMEWNKFEYEVNRYASQAFKTAPAPKSDLTPAKGGGVGYTELRNLFAHAGFSTFEEVSDFLRRLGKVRPFSADQAQTAKMHRSLVNIQSQIDGLKAQNDSLEAEVAQLKAQLKAQQDAGKDTGETQEKLDEKQAEQKEVRQVLREATSRKADVSASIKAGRTVVRPPVVQPRRQSTGDEFDETEASVDVEDAETRETPTHLVFDETGAPVVVKEDVVTSDDFDAGQKETTILSVLGAIRAMDGDAEVSEERFREELAAFTDGALPEQTADALWTYYCDNPQLDAASEEDVDDGIDSDGEAEGTQSASGAYGEKYAKAFSNKQLDRYLAFYRYVSPQNGREFQAGVNGIRDNIEAMKDALAETDGSDTELAATVRMLDNLFNSEAVVEEGVNGHADREALFTHRVMTLEDGSEGVTLDRMIARLMEKGDDNRPRCRQAAFFLSYLRGMRPENRRRFMSLACCSITAKKISMHPTEDGLSYTLSRDNGRYSSVSAFAAVGSFTGIIRLKAKDVKRLADEIVARIAERDDKGNRRYSFNSNQLSVRLREVADVLAPAIGHEAPILQAITSPHMYDALRRNYGTPDPRTGLSKSLLALIAGTTVYEPTDKKYRFYLDMPPMVKSVVDVLNAYANSVRDSASDAEKREKLTNLVVTEFSMGLETESAIEGNKDMSVDTAWSWALGAYVTGLPETVATANTLPERNSKIASKVAISLQDAPPVVRQFMDKSADDETGFAYHAYRVWLNNATPEGGAAMKSQGATEAELRERFETRVLPQCRQRLVWPNAQRSELVSKCIDRDYTADEKLEACANSFAEGWFDWESKRAKADPKDQDKIKSAPHWFVPVYNGDHSAGVILQLPTEIIFNGISPNFGKLVSDFVPGVADGAGQKLYKKLADRVNSWLGFDAFGNDSKRSSLACSEFAGRSMRGVKYANGKLVKGETRVHVVHNYAMEGHNDAFLGTTLATGYGLRAQQDVAKDLNTLTHKLHVMSGTGTDLTMLKSLVTAMWEYTGKQEPGVDRSRVRGKFLNGMATQALMDYIIKFREDRGDSDISTSMLVDEDSVKVGVLNSKTMGHYTGERDGKAEFEPLMQYIFKAIRSSGGCKGSLKGEALDKALCDNRLNGGPVADEDGKFRFWWVESSGAKVRKTVGELLGTEETPDGAIEVNVVKGLSGETLDFSYADNSLMSYAVANVSHHAKPSTGNMPRNNAIDGMVMGTGLRRAGLLKNPKSVEDGIAALSAWGILSAVVGTDSSNLEYARQTGTCAAKIRNGANPYGIEVTEQATRDMYKAMTDGIKPPLYKVDAPLVSAGAVYHEYSKEELADRAARKLPFSLGEVRDHTDDPFLKRLHMGSRVFAAKDAALYRTDRSLGYAHVNVSLEKTGFRYGWFVNDDQIDEVYKVVVGADPASVASDPMFEGDDWAKQRPQLARIERIFAEIARYDRLNADAVESYVKAGETEKDERKAAATQARAEAREKRDALMKLFRDHHARQMSDYGDYAYQVCFEDLFILRNDGTRGFDRSALVADMPDPNTFGGVPSLWLAGTTFGLPRTPSYNGSMWCQTVRASTPCTEIETESENGSVFTPGTDAMVMPDPQTLKILGCDHDGDKTACYMFKVDMRTGTAESADPLDFTPECLKPGASGMKSVYDFVDDPVTRDGYLADMVSKGIVRNGRKERDPETGRVVQRGLEVSDFFRNKVNNAIVRSYFDMSRNLKVDCGDAEKDFYGTPMAKATKAQPLAIVAGKNDPRWAQLKEKSLAAYNYLKGSRIGDAVTGAHVSTSAGIADKARGSIVSWAGILHLAQFSGCFDSRLFRFSDSDQTEKFMKWIGFMYGTDGVSNATFDDIKEQICLRIGWTSGMIDTFLADMMFDADENGRLREPPTTADEFFERLEKYVDSVAQYGSRFWMMISSEPSDSPYPVYKDKSSRAIHADLREMFGAKPGSKVTFNAVCGMLGIRTDGKSLVVDYDKANDKVLAQFVAEYVQEARRTGVASMPRDTTLSVDHFALQQLVRDISARGGNNPALGYVYSIRNDILAGKLVSDLAKGYLRWSNGMTVLHDARDFARSINFLKADPGSGTMMGNRKRMKDTFRSVMENGGENSDVVRLLASMFAANLAAYSAENAETMQGRMVLATNTRANAIGRWADEQRNCPHPAVHAVIERLWAEQSVDPNMLMQLEGNLMTVPYFLAALTSIPAATEGTDLMSGNGGTAAWATMEKMAEAATSDPQLGTKGVATSTLGFHKAFMALWGAFYGLVSTSKQARNFSALSYLKAVNAGFGVRTASGGNKYSYGDGLERLACSYRDKDAATQLRMWAATDRIANGELDPSRQRRETNNANAGGTKATSFVLSASNLRGFLAEMGPRQKGERAGLRDRVETAIRVLDALAELNGGREVEITPKTLLDQFFPVYATASARSSTPDPKSGSVLNVVRGLFARLSERQATFDSGVLERGMNLPDGHRLMDMVCSTDFAIPLLTAIGRGGQLATLEKLSKEQLGQVIEELAGSLNRDGSYSYEDNETLNELQKLVHGTDEKGNVRREKVRGNPKNRHFVGFLEGTQLLRSVHEYVNETLAGAPVQEGPRTDGNVHDPEVEEFRAVDPGEKDEDVQRLADFYRNCVGTWADVVYEGGDLITIKSRAGLKGSAATMFAGAMFDSRFAGKVRPDALRTDAVIQIRVGGDSRSVTADINSPAFAASLCNALRGADGREVITAEEFLRMTKVEREALVNAYAPGSVKNGVANFSLAKPSWSISQEGVATLCGQIHLADAKSHRKAFHEYFHAMVGMFRTMGVFGEADVKTLRAKYGAAPKGTDMLFNEEKAADDFAKYVDQMTNGATPVETDEAPVSIFRRILDLLESLFAVLSFEKFGFDYRGTNLAEDEHNVLFGMVLHGYAMQSGSRLRERGMNTSSDETAEKLAHAMRFTEGIMRSVEAQSSFDRRESENPLESSANRMYRKHENADPMADYEGQSDPELARWELGYHNALMAELERSMPRKSAIRQIVSQLAAIRTGQKATAFDRFRFRDDSVYMSVETDERERSAFERLRARREAFENAKATQSGEELRQTVLGLGYSQAVADLVVADKAKAEKSPKPTVSPAPSVSAERRAAERPAVQPEAAPVSSDVAEAAQAKLPEVEESMPEAPLPVAESVSELRAADEIASRYDPVDRGGRPGVVGGQQRQLRAVVAAAQTAASNLDPADLAILSGEKVTHNVYERVHAALNARREVNRRQVRHAYHAREMALAAAKKLTSLTGDNYMTPNTVNVLIHLYDSGYFKDAAGRTSRQKGRAVYGSRMGVSGGEAVTHAAKYASSASMAGAVLAAGGQRFGNAIDRTIRDIRELSKLAGGGRNEAMVRHVLTQLELVSAKADPTRILEDVREWNAALDTAAMRLFTGVKRGAYDATTHDFGDYEPSNSESELAVEIRDLYQFTKRTAGLPKEEIDAMKLRQKILRMAADALFATAAQVKFMREFGIGEGSVHHDAWMGRVTQSPVEFSEMTANFGIGAKNLAADSPLVSRWNDPVFVAANLDEWYAGTVRETFGSLPVREMMLSESRKLRGDMSALVRRVNFHSMKWGLNRAEGRDLLRLKRFESTHEMREGEFIKAVSGKFYEGFSNEKGFAGETVDFRLTEDGVRDAQLVHTYATAKLQGDDKLVTGIDKITFLPDDFRKAETAELDGYVFRDKSKMFTPADLSVDALNRRYEKTQEIPENERAARGAEFREMTSLEMALFRLSQQWHSSVTGLPDAEGNVAESTIGLYDKFMNAALEAADTVFTKYENGYGELPKGFDPAIFNDEVIRILEAKGLVVATAADDSKTDAEGVPLRTEAVLCIPGSEIDRMWDASEAKATLVEARLIDGTDEERERRKREFTADALAEDLGKALVEFKKSVRDLPWITKGDGRYLTNLDTMLPVFEGAGTFMYHANRIERDTVREQQVKLARHEMTWHNMLNDLALSGKNYEKLTDMQLRMIHDYFETDEQGSALMAAFKAGKYARGTAKSAKTGLEINPPDGTNANVLGTTMSDVCTQIYHKQLERRLLMLEGRKQADFETEDSIGRMLHEYEQASESGVAMSKGSGLTATQLYRLHGKLPVNFTIGHALVSVMRGVQNAMYFQSTLTNMLFTPDMEGDPLFFANPDRFNADKGCIPDAVWKAAAQWWASRLGPSVTYDLTKTGVENARAIYEMVQSSGKKDNGTYANFRRGAKRYATLGQDDLAGTPSLSGFMAQVEEDDSGMLNRWGSARGLFSLDGSEALGYARHLFQATRLKGGHMQWINHVMSWSKSMSVAYSVFFPIATKWESPTAAVGALATMGSNWSPDLVRKNAKALAAIQKLFTLGRKEGWIDENFIGFKDVIRMMDTNDPFLNDLVMWAEAIGVSMTDRLVNPMEPNKGLVVNDIAVMSGWMKKLFGDKAAANFDAMADALFLRQGEKAFTYALNATKLAVAAQVALRLKAEAVRQGKAFDPVRDMRGYAEYVDSEIGGVNPLRYAWAHPQMRSVLNKMWFSWEWTRTAWEAAGGGIIEDILFGGHTVSKGQKNVTLGRWLRMYGSVMIGFPILLQLAAKGLAKILTAAFGLPPDPDDDKDKWFTWENDSKIGVSAANITPLLKFVSRLDEQCLGGHLKDWKLEGQAGTALVGAALGAVKGSQRGLSGAVLGSIAGAGAGAVAPGLLPEYTGSDTFNTNRNRQYFVHGGKQGWEVTRWFTDPFGQFVSKLSMPVQKIMEGVVGFSLANPDFKTKMSEKSLPARWLDVLSPDSAWANLLGMFRPFTMSGWSNYGDAGIISAATPVQMGSSASSLISRGEKELNAWARNDRRLYARGGRTPGRVIHHAQDVLADLYPDAKAAGIVDFNRDIVTPVLSKVVPTLYKELFNALPQTPDGEYDKRKVERTVRALHRIGTKYEGMLASIQLRYEKAGDMWRKAGPEFQRRIEGILRSAEAKPFDMADEIPLRKDY